MSGTILRIKIFDERGGVQIVPVTKSTVSVGRAPHCDLVLNHSSVSAEHLRAWLEGGRIWLQDMGSTAGTFLNGTRLPTLKPMLVRDVDIIKLGTCPASLGLETAPVRAPVVRTPPPVPEHTMTEIRPALPIAPAHDVEKRREELAKVSREFAELKLQVQMARLDKNAGEDLRRQVNQLREEVREVTERRDRTEGEIRAMRKDAEREIRDLQSSANRKLSHWKVDVVASLNRRLRRLTEDKTRAWSTRTLTPEMMLNFESEVNQLVRRAVLEEASPAYPAPATEAKAAASQPPASHLASASSSTTASSPTSATVLSARVPTTTEATSRDSAPHVKTETKANASPAGLGKPTSSMSAFDPAAPAKSATSAVSSALASAFANVGAAVAKVTERKATVEEETTKTPVTPAAEVVSKDSYLGDAANEPTMIGIRITPEPSRRLKLPRGRNLAITLAVALVLAAALAFKITGRGTNRGVASEAPVRAAAPIPKAPMPTRPKPPRQTSAFKNSYIENVLFTDSFPEIEANPQFHAQWSAELTKVATQQWRVNASAIGVVLNKEQNLMQDLVRVRDTGAGGALTQVQAQMKPIEAAFRTEVTALLGGDRNYQNFYALKKTNYTRNRAYLTISH